MAASDHTILQQAADWLKSGRKVAIATVVETWGSAPQPIGSQLVIDEEGNFIGSVSGGCVEAAVVDAARGPDACAAAAPGQASPKIATKAVNPPRLEARGQARGADCRAPLAPCQLRFGILPALAAKAGSIGMGHPSRQTSWDRKVVEDSFNEWFLEKKKAAGRGPTRRLAW